MKMEDLYRDGYFYEYKQESAHWKKRLVKVALYKKLYNTKVEIIFLVGNNPHRFMVGEISSILKTDVPVRYAEPINTESAYAIRCVPWSM